MDPLLRKAILVGFDLALAGLNKQEVDSFTDQLAAEGKTKDQISAILDDLSGQESTAIRALIASKRSAGA